MALEEDGHLVVSSNSGAKALAKAHESRPDLVVLDISMPNIDGINLLGRLLDIDNTLPVILHSGYQHYRDNFMTWCADAFVVKSSDPTELRLTVLRVLRERKGDQRPKSASATLVQEEIGQENVRGFETAGQYSLG